MENNEKKENDMGLDFEGFLGEEGAFLTPPDQLVEANKKLPKWDIEPPSKYKK